MKINTIKILSILICQFFINSFDANGSEELSDNLELTQERALVTLNALQEIILTDQDLILCSSNPVIAAEGALTHVQSNISLATESPLAQYNLLYNIIRITGVDDLNNFFFARLTAPETGKLIACSRAMYSQVTGFDLDKVKPMRNLRLPFGVDYHPTLSHFKLTKYRKTLNLICSPKELLKESKDIMGAIDSGFTTFFWGNTFGVIRHLAVKHFSLIRLINPYYIHFRVPFNKQKRDFSYDEINLFFKSLENTNVYEIYLSWSSLDTIVIKNSFNSLKSTDVYVVDLSYNSIGNADVTDADLTAIAQGFKGTKVHTLDLTYNRFSSKQAISFINGLAGANIRDINFQNNFITDSDIEDLPQALKDANIDTIDLSGNNISAEGFSKLISKLNGSNVHTIKFRVCILGVGSFGHIRDLYKSNVESIYQAVQGNKIIKTIDLSGDGTHQDIVPEYQPKFAELGIKIIF